VLDHITIRCADRGESEDFYDTVLQTIGIERSGRDDEYTVWRGQFSLAAADDDHPVTRKLAIRFAAPSREHVDAFRRAGYRDAGAASLLDPEGNVVEAVHHGGTAIRGAIDQLWIGVADVDAARRFYEAAAPFTGYSLGTVAPGRVHFAGANGSFGLVARLPTENLHVAFEATDNATVDAFHRELTAAGYRDNGRPGERDYHPGYYGAFVLDPDGNNAEVVNHNS
jgi:catechol 2,3-dioxygenase-like lactoylglutathione lyase family enzyme